MRKVVLALLFLIAGLSQLYAQSEGRYKLTLTFSPIKNTGNDMRSTEYRVSSVSAAGTNMCHLHLRLCDISMRWRIRSLRNFFFGVKEHGMFSLVRNQERAPMS